MPNENPPQVNPNPENDDTVARVPAETPPTSLPDWTPGANRLQTATQGLLGDLNDLAQEDSTQNGVNVEGLVEEEGGPI